MNKKSLESLAYAGAFDCFKEIHRAQYFYVSQGDPLTGIEKIIRFGNVFQANKSQSVNSLFGDSVMPEIATPKLPVCEEWTLTEKLDFEKEVTGMFMSGHPLDHFKFELKHYGIMNLADFNEIKDSSTLIAANANRSFRIAGLVVDAQHRVTKTGRNFGALSIEDFSGKSELMLWSDDYTRHQNYLNKGYNLLINGFFKQRFNSDQYEFKVTNIMLLETAKQVLTRQVEVNMTPASVTKDFVNFIDNNVKANPGKHTLRFNVYDPIDNLKITLYTLEKGFTMNEEMAGYLLTNPDVEVSVGLAG